MHNLDSFLKHVTDDIAVNNSTKTTETAPKATKKGSKSKVKTEPVAASGQDSPEEVESVISANTNKPATAGKLKGGVNFILADIDTANSLVRP